MLERNIAAAIEFGARHAAHLAKIRALARTIAHLGTPYCERGALAAALEQACEEARPEVCREVEFLNFSRNVRLIEAGTLTL